MVPTCGRIPIVPAAGAHSELPEPAGEKAPHDERLPLACDMCLRVVALVLVAYSFAVTAWRARGEPRDLTFVAGTGAVIAALFCCLRRAQRLTPASPLEERRRLQVAVWVLSTLLSCAFAYRISLVMPVALVIVIWCMTSFIVIMGFCMLVLCSDRQYEAVDDVDCNATAVDGKGFNKMSPADELV